MLDFRTKLRLAFASLLLICVGLAGTAIWMVGEIRHHSERSLTAQQVLQGVLTISARSYKLLKVYGDTLNTGRPAEQLQEERLIAEIEASIRAVRAGIALEIQRYGLEEREELDRLARIEQRVQDFLYIYRELKKAPLPEQRASGWRRLTAALDGGRDPSNTRFEALIREAVDDENEETREADQAETALHGKMQLLTWSLLVAAMVMTLVLGHFLQRSVRRPLDHLLEGTEALSSGNLRHRIPVLGGDEFGRLAQRFNEMAQDLAAATTTRENSHTALERAVQERTRELNEAKERLETVDRLRRRFIADISHEIRTPLTIIRGEGEITLRGGDKAPEDYKSALRRVVEQATHTSRLVDDLLFVARQQAGETRVRFAAVAIGELVEAVSRDAASLAEPRSIRIACRTAPQGVVVLGDHGRLRQMLLILIDNAIRYSPSMSEVAVAVEQDGGRAVVSVSDQGIGIPEADQPHVFDRYYRGSNAEPVADGSGLGLPMAKAIVEAHGGEISIASVEGRGTTVRVALPATGGLKAVA
jgi:signal transduction histidine kinase